MKGLNSVSKETQTIITRDRSTWVKLYYDISKDTVYTRDDNSGNRIFVTNLINPNTPDDIKETILSWSRS